MHKPLLAACVLGLLGLYTATALAAEPAVGEKADFSYKTTDGKLVTPETVKGHIIIFDFWATWCGPCMQMAPHMVELNKTYADKGVAIVGVSLDDDAKAMASVAKEKGFTWPQICDGKGWSADFAVAWGVKSIPHCVIIGPDGTVLWSGHPANIDAPLKAAVEKYPYQPPEKEKPADKPPATAPAPVAEKPAAPTIAPAILDARMAAADKDKAAGRKVDAYETYKWVAAHAPGTDQANTAQTEVAAFDADPDFVKAYKKVLVDRDAASTLWLANSLEKSGKTDDAAKYYRKIITDFAATPSAAAAKEALAQMK